MPTVADLRVRFSADTAGAIGGINKVNNAINGMASGAKNALGGLDFGQMFNVAGGNLIASGIRNITSSVMELGGEALSIYSDYERLTMSLETFAAQELMAAGGASSMSEALAMSGERAQEVLGWIEKLAVESPFESTDISSAFRLAQAYGFTSDQAMRLTQATVDFAAGAGISGAMMDRISLALGQIQARGKVSAQELNQLSEAGINARGILAKAFNVSTASIMEMIEKGLVPADLAIEAITQSLEKDFGGAAKRQANTFSGLISSLSDLKSIGLREFFRGTFEAVQPSLQKFVEFVTNPAVKENLRSWGDSIGQYIGGALAVVEERANRAMATFNLLSGQGDTIGGILAGVGQMTGGEVTINTKTKVTKVDWGNFTYTYNALSQITSVDWFGNWFTGANGAASFTYDAAASVLSVDWSSKLGSQTAFVYDANAGIKEVHWNFENFKYNYNATAGITTVNFFSGFFVGTYTATASITDVGWGLYTHFYNASAKVDKMNVLWGAYSHTYSAEATVTDVGWGLFSHSYNAGAQVSDTNILWGGFTHTYDAKAQVSENSIFWGLYSYTYDAKAQVTEVTWFGGALERAKQSLENLTITAAPEWVKNLTINLAPGILTTLSQLIIKPPAMADMLPLLTMNVPTLPADFWPSLPTFTWPSLPSFEWPTLPEWAWPTLPTFTWPTLPTWTWPSIPMPGWVNQLVALFGGGGVSASRQSAAPAQSQGGGFWSWITGNAGGTSYWRGGWTWVGEKGPELINLPQGAQVYSNANSKAMIGQLATGTTSAPAVWPGGGPTFAQNYEQRLADIGGKFQQAGDKVATKIQRQMEAAAKKHRQEMEQALQSVPGLFGTSQVTQQQMDMASLGVPQNFADDWIRRLTDEVVNGVDWAGVDIKDAAARAGIDPSLPAKAILELVKEKWNDSSLFAGGANLDLINQDAVQAALARQADAASGKAALMNLFGITPEQATGQAVALGTSMRSGIEQGLTQPTTGGGANLLTGLTTVTPEQMAPVGAGIVDSLSAQMDSDEYKEKIGAAFTKLFTGFLAQKEALTDVGAQIMSRIAESLGNVTGIDMVGRFATGLRAQLTLPDAIDTLHDVGARILELVYQGYFDAAKEKDWPRATIQPAAVNPPPATTTTATGRSALAAAGAGGPVVNVYATVASGIDIHQVAYQVADIMQKRSRR